MSLTPSVGRSEEGVGSQLPAAATRTYEVGELAWELKDALGMVFRNEVWIRGQIRDLSRSNANHVYFNLVEPAPAGEVPKASLRVALFDSHRKNVNRVLGPSASGHMTDGVEVRIKASVEFWIRGGQLSLHMHDIDPNYTLEKLSADRDMLLAALLKENLLDRNKKLPMPVRPLRIGLVSSPNSAAYADFYSELERSGMGWQILFARTAVQGFGSELEIAAALAALASEGVDAIALVRGGGSRTDLAAFDSREVAYAIARCAVPVLTGIGHETDNLVVDMVAHASFKTPTACAVELVDRVERFRQTTQQLKWDICAAAAAGLDEERHRLAAAGKQTAQAGIKTVEKARGRLLTAAGQIIQASERRLRSSRFALERQRELLRERTRFRLEVQRRELQTLASRTCSKAAGTLKTARQQLRSLKQRTQIHDPQRMMKRGWTTLSTENGKLLRSIGDTEAGSSVSAQLLDGKIKCKVTELLPYNSPPQDSITEKPWQ